MGPSVLFLPCEQVSRRRKRGRRAARQRLGRQLPWVLCFALASLASRSLVANEPALVPTDFYVATNGNDAWTGRFPKQNGDEGPFATVARAQVAVRKALERDRSKPVRVFLGAGTYYLEAPLEFGPADSGTAAAPVTFCAMPGERAVLSGGQRLRQPRLNQVRGRQVWTVDVADLGANQQRQLFVNGVRAVRARLPEQGVYRIEALPGYNGDFLRSPTQAFVFAPGDISSNWHNLQDAEVVALTRWQDNRLPIVRVDADTRTATFDRPSLFALHSGQLPEPYWVENVLEGLDAPGEWYFDRSAHEIHYLPRVGQDMGSAELVLPRHERLLRIVGRPGEPVHDLHFENLTLSHAEWQLPADYAASLQAGIEAPGAVLFEYAEGCSVKSAAIEHVGGYGIEVGVGCANLAFSRNRLTDLGAGGIRIGHFFSWETDGNGQLTERGRLRKASMPTGPRSRGILVADNEIGDGGRLFPSAVGVFVGDNPDNQVVHNHIHHLYYSGVSVGSVQDFGASQATANLVERNYVHHIGQGMLSDLAGIYACSAPGTQIRFNRIHDVTRRNYGGWGIYLDEGSHDLLVRSNLVFGCQDGALFAHHNRNIVAENNILALNPAAQIERGGIGGFELTCRKNIVFYEQGEAVGSYGNARCGRDVCAFDDNLYWNASGKPPTFGGKSLREWQALGHDRRSVVADPRFTNPSHGDFQLQSDSPAKSLGSSRGTFPQTARGRRGKSIDIPLAVIVASS